MSEESEIAQRDAIVTSCIERKDKKGALRACLQNPPVNSKSDEIKLANLVVVEKALSAISDSEVSGLIDGLSLEECDLLMKYVYKMMSVKSSCSTMLKMHAKLVEKAGLGSIVRAMTDRKQV